MSCGLAGGVRDGVGVGEEEARVEYDVLRAHQHLRCLVDDPVITEQLDHDLVLRRAHHLVAHHRVVVLEKASFAHHDLVITSPSFTCVARGRRVLAVRQRHVQHAVLHALRRRVRVETLRRLDRALLVVYDVTSHQQNDFACSCRR